jgi:hypothetical protein
MICRYPEQWMASGSYTLKHPEVAEIGPAWARPGCMSKTHSAAGIPTCRASTTGACVDLVPTASYSWPWRRPRSYRPRPRQRKLALSSVLARISPRPLPWPHRQRLPGGDGPSALPRLRIVGHSREQPAQLDGRSELAALVEGGADGGGLCLRDDGHPASIADYNWQAPPAFASTGRVNSLGPALFYSIARPPP